MTELAYKANAAEVLARLTRLVSRQARDQIFAAFILPSRAMADFQQRYSGDFMTEYPDPHERIAFWDRHLSERTRLEDDSIPAAYPSEFDQGLYGGLFGGDVRFLSMPHDGYVGSGWISSMVPPLLHDWSEFGRLAFDEEAVWCRRYKAQLRIMSEVARGRFGISHLIVIDSLNFVFELVGATNTYISMYETPDYVREAIAFAYDLNLRVHDAFFDIVGTLAGGTCSWVVPWLPGKIVCESLDPFHMTSLTDLERWGRAPLERFVSNYDGAVLHLHANGWYLLESACSLEGVKALLLVNEKDHPPATEIGFELRKRSGDMPLSMMAEYPDFLERLARHELPGGVFYYVTGAPDSDAANRCMEQVRAYRV
jgi:hypothetical protein